MDVASIPRMGLPERQSWAGLMEDQQNPDQNAAGLESVRNAELKDIRQRRRIIRQTLVESVQPPDSCDASTNEEHIEQDLSGLALSGGGIRSSCFNMGIVQAFHAGGLYRSFDYLSTVSGGGYIGGFLSTSLLHAARPIDESTKTFPIAQQPNEQPSPTTRRFIYRGLYLMRPMQFLNKYLIGVTMNNIAVLSMMICIAAVVAFLWRSLDYPLVADYIEQMTVGSRYLDGFGSDLMRPLIPSIFLAIIWLVSWFLSYFQRQAEAPGSLAQIMLVATGSSLLIAIAVLLGNGDIALPEFLSSTGSSGDGHIVVPDRILLPVISLVVLALIPLLRPSRLLNSAISPQKPWEKWVFNATGTALVAGVPLLFTAILARENISGYSTSPDRPLQWPEVSGKHWPEFVQLTSQQGTPRSEDFRYADSAVAVVNSFATASAGGLLDPVIVARTIGRSVTSVKRALAFAADREGLRTALKAMLENAQVYGVDDQGFADLPEAVRQDPYGFLVLVGEQIAVEQRKLTELRHQLRFQSGTEAGVSSQEPAIRERPLDSWKTDSGGHEMARLWATLGYMLEVAEDSDKTEFGRYRHAVEQRSRLLAVYMAAFNLCILPTPEFTAQLRVQHQMLKDEIPGRSWAETTGLLAHQRIHAAESFVRSMGRESRYRESDVLFPASGTSTERYPELAILNRSALEALVPNVIVDRWTYQRRVVILEDQQFRLKIAVFSLVVFFGLGIWVDINATSMHRFYRTLIASEFLVRPEGKMASYKLSDLKTTDFGGPCHLIGGCISIFRKKLSVEDSTASTATSGDSPNDLRWNDTFLMSRRFCGSDVTGYIPTVVYEKWIAGDNQHLDISEAIALSGAAVSPSQNRNWLVAFLMFTLNVRLGQWLPNPGCGKPKYRPRFFYLTQLMFRAPSQRTYSFVSDGGHVENLGLVELLKRRCRLIIVSDASQDQKHTFSDFARAVREARIHHGISLESLPENLSSSPSSGTSVSMDDLRLPSRDRGRKPDADSSDTDDERLDRAYTRKHFVAARIRYPEKAGDEYGIREGLLIYVKASLTGDESLDVLEYSETHPEFPHQPTTDQLYDEMQMEAYRQLGWHIGCELLKLLNRENSEADGESSTLRSAHRSIDALLSRENSVSELAKQFESGIAATAATEPGSRDSVNAPDAADVMDEAPSGNSRTAPDSAETHRSDDEDRKLNDALCFVKQQNFDSVAGEVRLDAANTSHAEVILESMLDGAACKVSEDELTFFRYWIMHISPDSDREFRRNICSPLIEAFRKDQYPADVPQHWLEYWMEILERCGHGIRYSRKAHEDLEKRIGQRREEKERLPDQDSASA